MGVGLESTLLCGVPAAGGEFLFSNLAPQADAVGTWSSLVAGTAWGGLVEAPAFMGPGQHAERVWQGLAGC